jgi:hypothetical protein
LASLNEQLNQSTILPGIEARASKGDAKTNQSPYASSIAKKDAQYSVPNDDLIRLKRVYRANHHHNNTEHHSPTSVTPTLVSSKKEQLKKLKLDVSNIAR